MKGITVIFVLFAFGCVQMKPIDIETILEGVPHNERLRFLKEHIKIGHELSQERESGAGYDDSEIFSIQVYNLMKTKHAIEDEQMLNVLSNIICFDDGICIDIGDTGVHPKL